MAETMFVIAICVNIIGFIGWTFKGNQVMSSACLIIIILLGLHFRLGLIEDKLKLNPTCEAVKEVQNEKE